MSRTILLSSAVLLSAALSVGAVGCVPMKGRAQMVVPMPPDEGTFVVKNFCREPVFVHFGPEQPNERSYREVIEPGTHLVLKWRPPPNDHIWISRPGQPMPRRIRVPFAARRVFVPAHCMMVDLLRNQ